MARQYLESEPDALTRYAFEEVPPMERLRELVDLAAHPQAVDEVCLILHAVGSLVLPSAYRAELSSMLNELRARRMRLSPYCRRGGGRLCGCDACDDLTPIGWEPLTL